ncbi:hypothetical protein AAE478_004092 [Parahypoxylon ruwenzoriense]
MPERPYRPLPGFKRDKFEHLLKVSLKETKAVIHSSLRRTRQPLRTQFPESIISSNNSQTLYWDETLDHSNHLRLRQETGSGLPPKEINRRQNILRALGNREQAPYSRDSSSAIAIRPSVRNDKLKEGAEKPETSNQVAGALPLVAHFRIAGSIMTRYTESASQSRMWAHPRKHSSGILWRGIMISRSIDHRNMILRARDKIRRIHMNGGDAWEQEGAAAGLVQGVPEDEALVVRACTAVVVQSLTFRREYAQVEELRYWKHDLAGFDYLLKLEIILDHLLTKAQECTVYAMENSSRINSKLSRGQNHRTFHKRSGVGSPLRHGTNIDDLPDPPPADEQAENPSNEWWDLNDALEWQRDQMEIWSSVVNGEVQDESIFDNLPMR